VRLTDWHAAPNYDHVSMEGGRDELTLRLRGGPDAARRARQAVLSHFGHELGTREQDDVELLISELVSNSVRHAGVGSDQRLAIAIRRVADRLHLAVIDHGSASTPHVVQRDAQQPGGLGLFVVEQLSSSWGVQREGDGSTRVWCELPLQA
jgi:serine/threonine-protein kinase RsbW